MEEKRNLDMAAAISAALNDEEHMKKTARILKEFCDGKPVNKNPLGEVPNPEIVVYCTRNSYFLKKEDLEMYCKNNNISKSNTYTMEYYRKFAGRSDVIKMNGDYYAAVDEDGYGVYNYDRSVYRGEYTWEFEYGHLRTEYQLLKDIGITLENDVYGDIDKRNEYIKQKIKEKNDDFKRKLSGNN